ncbi:MAG: GNAT family N-acetyltransferase [Chloroflexi bacterium]|nr:GNAT family N-acetyltransferase [Chloroflexota bacterium]
MLHGKKVILRPFRREDLERANELMNDLELRLLGDSSPPVPWTIDRLTAWYEKKEKDDKAEAQFAIEADDKYIGKCSLYDFSEADRTCQMSIEVMDKAYWGKGYGREAVELLIDYAFRIRNMRKMTLVTSSHNERAIRSYLGIGFKEEGRFLRQQWNNGRYVDWIFMGLFRDDWERKSEPVAKPADLLAFNRDRWNALAEANIPYARPLLDLTPKTARAWLEAQGSVPAGGGLDDLAGKDVLCLASGGGQQTAAFGLLGANISVLDISDAQLERDRQAAEHYKLPIRIEQGSMGDLSVFDGDSFDLVWQPYSINFFPDARRVFDEVRRVLRPGGLYRLTFNNPFRAGLTDEDWNGNGYALKRPYVEGAEMWPDDDVWTVEGEDGRTQRIIGPKEFNHTLGGIVNSLIERDFVLCGLWEDNGRTAPDCQARPGTWEHFIAIAPPYLAVWARLGFGV